MAVPFATVSANEVEIKLGLCGTPADRQRAVEALWRECSRDVLVHVERKFPGLPSDSGVEIVGQAIEDLLQEIDSDRIDWNQPLLPLLITIAHRRAVDELRKWRVRPLSKADFYDFVTEEVAETQISASWGVRVRAGEADELQQQFRDFVLTLPRLQRLVAQVVYDNLPEKLEHTFICDEFFRRTGKHLTAASLKSALREFRRKFHQLIDQ